LKEKMSEKNKYGKAAGDDFLRYHSGKMTEKERNAFEKELQKDPFAEEASEGFSSIDAETAGRDLADLNRRLRKRVSAANRRLWYGIAASVAVLLTISAILLLYHPENRIEEIAYNQPESSPGEPGIQIAEPEKDLSESKPAESPKKAAVEEKSEAYRPSVVAADKPDIQQETLKKEDISVTHDPVRPAAVSEVARTVIAEKRKERKVTLADMAVMPPAFISGRIISSEDNLPLPGASIMIKGTNQGTVSDENGYFTIEDTGNQEVTLVAGFIGMDSKEFKAIPGAGNEIILDPSALALNEIVVVGHGLSGKSSDSEDTEPGYSPPAPVTGHREFNRYIRENMIRPDTATAGQRNVVVLSFVVSETGNIDSIEVVRSKGRIYSDEAIRLLKEGPAWKPAIEYGIEKSERVRLRIVFR
jgi:outer membrane biosynthesis protein TonB